MISAPAGVPGDVAVTVTLWVDETVLVVPGKVTLALPAGIVAEN